MDNNNNNDEVPGEVIEVKEEEEEEVPVERPCTTSKFMAKYERARILGTLLFRSGNLILYNTSVIFFFIKID